MEQKHNNCSIKLWYGNCIDKMPKIPDKSIDLILCDLPYGTTKCHWDTIINLDQLWTQYERIIKDNGAILLFAQTPFDKILGCSNIRLLRYEIIWEKTHPTGHLNANKMPLKAHENILVFYKKLPTYNPQKTQGHPPSHSYTARLQTQNNTYLYGKRNQEIKGGGNTDRFPISIIRFPSDKQKNNLHPTQKPIKLLEYLIKTYSNPGDIILDNCMGSGSTGIACLETNRSFIEIEKDIEYYKCAINRIETHLEKLSQS